MVDDGPEGLVLVRIPRSSCHRARRTDGHRRRQEDTVPSRTSRKGRAPHLCGSSPKTSIPTGSAGHRRCPHTDKRSHTTDSASKKISGSYGNDAGLTGAAAGVRRRLFRRPELHHGTGAARKIHCEQIRKMNKEKKCETLPFTGVVFF